MKNYLLWFKLWRSTLIRSLRLSFVFITAFQAQGTNSTKILTFFVISAILPASFSHYSFKEISLVKTGLPCAKGDWIVMMDADGQHKPEDIANLLEYREGFDMVVGARSRGSKTVLHRDIANKLYNIQQVDTVINVNKKRKNVKYPLLSLHLS